MKKINIVLMIMASAFIISCESNTYNEVSVISANPTYTANVAPVVKANCTSCHSGGSRFPNLETYQEVKDATQNGDLICRIDDPSVCFGSIMPTSGRMQQTSIDMFKLWRDQGYAN
jgi:hypothetical protein